MAKGTVQQSRRDRPSGLSGASRPHAGPERQSSPRLATFDYIGHYAYSITVNTVARQRTFTSSAVVDDCLSAMTDAVSRHEFVVHAYCFMPDHLHLLIEGSESSSLASMMKRFKQMSSYRYKKRAGCSLWQRSYYDHVLRQEEDRNVVAEYIWNNPVRAGIVVNRAAYPFSGPREMMGVGGEPDRPEGLSLRGVGDVPMRMELRQA
ncbi:MAG: transposase [Chloroflexi bacterium]|nr:transposase [Chloroflexota bacterium]